jgi:hypothetical protein
MDESTIPIAKPRRPLGIIKPYIVVANGTPIKATAIRNKPIIQHNQLNLKRRLRREEEDFEAYRPIL